MNEPASDHSKNKIKINSNHSTIQKQLHRLTKFGLNTTVSGTLYIK